MTIMTGIFLFSETPLLAKQLLTPALELKRSLGQPITALVLDAANADDLAALGADRVLVLQSTAGWVEGLGDAVYDLVKDDVSVLLVGGTQRGKHLAAHVAAKLDAGLSTDAKSLTVEDGKLVTSRVLYAGLAVVVDELTFPAVATIPPRSFTIPEAAATAGSIETIGVIDDGRVSIVETTPTESSGVDISTANKLVSVGRGFASKDDLSLAESLAAKLKGEVSCTRGIAEDAHWLPIERYIGISGQTVKPDLYLAVGLSGQVQHMVGARESKVIVAINNDERAPIFEAADYGIVGDLYTVLPLLDTAIDN
ncbi:electron transfer flavoprotein subunit alpha/FixB family protein [Brenneria goodwinii]|uniref:Electron transfer flavoprotein, alpha subunit n=2 Tax=Brenneria goodwinii TaxID=1109412 RepID=A0A0G4JYF0_9GAMM|nr:electron transfer flavoprotein subunit alpha/FixB family protein [Brenneria goodwinii]MCG8157232.1 electron transfer flavoprotein subunit alpha/FixB family protein [Brenneria goodwinii]MCG8162186.1 electron transfer flavoprotein subunit alpha/FixB family protein [Brenneria goodwinii]MCG8166116.1 electron transfer flavoprotein subunit alpha/FixB family protein [Brenneria goodwinii]MCG8170743.1 electron transfer flavoprotein subunit alpha/FixB family protein [Brenneria goodwinii]MCG8175812.1 